MTDEAKTVHGPVWYPGLGWEVRLYYDTEEAAQGFAVFAANGFKAHQDRHPPVLLWEPASGAPATGPLPPDHVLVIYSVHIGSEDNTVTIEYSAVGIG
jgi:hypothetical protein